MDVPNLAAIDGRRRVAIENLRPVVDCGRFPIKRTLGQQVAVTVDAFSDGHDVVRVGLLTRKHGAADWTVTAMEHLGNDHWHATFSLDELGRYEYTVRGWVDLFETWHRDLRKRLEAGQDVSIDLRIGAGLVAEAVERAAPGDVEKLRRWQTALASGSAGLTTYQAGATDLDALMAHYPDHRFASLHEPAFGVVVDPPTARYSAWYELFPRSCSPEAGRHGTFRDVIAWLPRVSELGFNVVYLPPIHPIGMTFRKGKNNNVQAQADEPGSPWAIGSPAGGHKAIHPELGTLEDLHQLVSEARRRGIDLALDIAFQSSPEHPYVKQHRAWFRERPDGTIQYAENPPKKYQDIYPFHFETEEWQSLWRELTDVVLYWCQQGIQVFRVDNPHTKPFAFWEYLISTVKQRYPAAIFLSEAFTRTKIMYRLGKLGFTQSYTYFTWRSSKAELTDYFTELTQTDVREFFRPNVWPNTPDILPEHLQHGGRGAFIGRLVLAATLSANYGIYGPAYETLEHEPLAAGSEEYLNSEKYEIRQWDFDKPDGLANVIAAVNRARRENTALQSDWSLRFHPTDNDQLICYSKQTLDRSNVIVTIVNLHFHEMQRGFVELPLADWGIDPERPYQVQDLLGETTFTWQGPRNFVELDPTDSVAHILRLLPQS